MNPTSIREVVGLIPEPAQWVKDPALGWAVVWVADAPQILRCYGCGVRRQQQLRYNP